MVNVEVTGHHAQSQAAPTPSSSPSAPGVLGRWHHVWLPTPYQLGLGLCPQLLPDDQRDSQHLDSLPAYLVFRVAPPGAGGGPGLPRRAVPLAAARLPAARLPLPLRVVLRAHLQLHVAPRAAHLLLPGLRRAQPLQPGLRLPLCRLLHAGLLAARSPAPALRARRRAQLLPVHRPLLLLAVPRAGEPRAQQGPSHSRLHLSLPVRQPPALLPGHSHQLFHICAVLGTHFQLEAVLADMGSRRAWLAAQEPPLGLEGTVVTLGLAVTGNLLIIAAFTAFLLRAPGTCPLLQGGPPEGGLQDKQQ
ncbi:membrane progestin receptor delta isoform X3 [Castor canadensis]|uniref:Membrane progestin receptor delta isoform X3 n=1 Tax=Castor canadensis TaxID=51338 RepID=A0AC58KGD3_CASCN